MSKNSIFETIADGLDASADGRGWNAEHEAARRLANAAPDLLAACINAESLLAHDPNHMHDGWMSDVLREIRAAIAKATAAKTADKPQYVHMRDVVGAAGAGIFAAINRDNDLRAASVGFKCQTCGRDEADCSADPCAAVIADREA